MSTFALASIAAWALAVSVAGIVRGRPYVVFVSIVLGIYTLVSTSLAPHTGVLFPAFAYLHATVYASFVFLARPRMRPLAFRVLVSWPASWFLASTLFAFPWAIAVAFGVRPLGFFVPYAVALLGFIDTFLPRRQTVHVVVGEPARGARPCRGPRGKTCAHCGSCRSPTRPRPVHVRRPPSRICERTVAADPDLVILTGDFLTMESQADLRSSAAPWRR